MRNSRQAQGRRMGMALSRIFGLTHLVASNECNIYVKLQIT